MESQVYCIEPSDMAAVSVVNKQQQRAFKSTPKKKSYQPGAYSELVELIIGLYRDQDAPAPVIERGMQRSNSPPQVQPEPDLGLSSSTNITTDGFRMTDTPISIPAIR
jgi:hypothetical protein